MKRFLLIIACVSGGFFASAQQDYQLTHYMFDKLSFNPGYAGTTGRLCGTLIQRWQWSRYTPGGQPQTTLFNVHAPLKKIKSGVGLTIFQDQLGEGVFSDSPSGGIKDMDVRASYSYHLKLGAGTLGIGLSAGLINKTLGANWNPIDAVSMDDVLNEEEQSAMTYDLGFGIYYTTDNYYLGLSSTHLTANDLKDMAYSMDRHYFVTAGYNYAIGGDANKMLMPSVLAKSDGVTAQIDINVLYQHNNMFWGGVSYRLQDAIAPMLGIIYPLNERSTLKGGYSYDVTTSDIREFSSGSHELFINYCVKLRKKLISERHRNTRFL